MGERGLAIRTGITKQGWENADFPILCETCLGDNPYVRMMKQNFGTVCKICTRPYTLFRWKAGTDGRFKSTVVCQTCAKIKNVCQTCIFDLDFGLPVELRDKLLEEKRVNLPQNEAFRDYFVDQLDTVTMPYEELKNHPLLEKIQRRDQGTIQSIGTFNRNKPHICSFFLKGDCNRGDECPYRHEIPEESEVNTDQNIKNRYFGKNDKLAKKIMENTQINMPQPPENKKIKTIIVHNCQDLREQDLKRHFEKFGEIEQLEKKDKIAMINFNTREQAETCFSENYGKLTINNILLGISWQNFYEDSESEDGLLIPGSKFKLLKKDIIQNKKPQAPKLPPSDSGNDLKVQHQFLLNMLQNNDKVQYPSMNPLSMGGVDKKVKLN